MARELVGRSAGGEALEGFINETDSSCSRLEVPLPLALRTGHDTFSFCGLRTATVRRITEETSLQSRRAIGRAFLEAGIGQLERKVRHWIHKLREDGESISGLVLSGGVASNLMVRNRCAMFRVFENLTDCHPTCSKD